MSSLFYLEKLQIQNFATFKNQTINFRPGFNAIIGETGSGKSLVLEALQLILGARSDKKIVRRDADCALIEGTLKCTNPLISKFLDSEGFPIESNEIIIKRLIYRNGSSKTYINHLSSTTSFLNSFAKKYVDFIGQFENQKLLSENYQLFLLDQFSKIGALLGNYQKKYKEQKDLKNQIDDLVKSKEIREQRLDFLNYQLNELETLNPSSQDEERLLQIKHALLNHERNQLLLSNTNNLVKGNDADTGIQELLKRLISIVMKNMDALEGALDNLLEIQERIQHASDYFSERLCTEFEETDLEGVINRLDMYQRIKKKFGGTIESVLEQKNAFQFEKEQLLGIDINLGEIQNKLVLVTKEVSLLANSLHESRLRSAPILSKLLTSKVRQLKMNGATIDIRIEKTGTYCEVGITQLYFEAETNPGEGYFKIKDIASGGELSRILLALRQILSSHESISLFLFDEIDTGVGGETAQSIGRALMEVAQKGQVIAITHLPQIAQYCDSLVVINKDTDKERTESRVKEYSGKLIQKEVFEMARLAQ